ncbi:acyclic terpene utilization AtuA family protein [Neobacillus sp. NPDC097160]|uniref:acyclic terpene utilization AtuA family protein n=1 Tax=Neobacillus sp. NPDC097160 TaxID=3364298 RepID=UPI00381D9DCC
MKKVRIGAAQGFYGDTIDAAVATAEYGDVQYLCFDALAELTMAILVKDKRKNENAGFTKDIPQQMKALLPYVKEKGIKLLTNGGGINPVGAQQEILRVARDSGISGLKVAVVTGDNILDRIPEFLDKGYPLNHLETGNPIDTIKEKLEFANAYIGAEPIVKALEAGADIVVTGRTTDTAQFLAPLIYEYGWSQNDWDKLASGVFMGHLLECSAQSTGGNFSGNWWEIEGFDRMGYPIAEVSENGEFIISKVEDRGGLVTVDTVKEQMLYEIHDPSAYITPDVIVDLTNVTLKNVGDNQVKVTGVNGKPRTDSLKVVMGYENGYAGQVIVGFSWPDAMLKAKKVDEIIRSQVERMGLNYQEIRTDFMGYNALSGPLAHDNRSELNEVFLRMIVRAETKQEAAKFSRLFPPIALNGPPSMSGFTGNAAPRSLIGMWSTLIPREEVEYLVKVEVVEV